MAFDAFPAGEASSPDPYRPTPIDIVVVREMLSRGCRLPPDIVDAVFDHAEYWAYSSNYIDYQEEHGSALRINGSRPTENKFLVSLPHFVLYLYVFHLLMARKQLRSFPVGFTGLGSEKSLTEELVYDMNELTPRPLGKEHDTTFFRKLPKYPTPRLVHPVRKVVFTIKSHDQGWSSSSSPKGGYEGSHTWFEAGLERFDAEQQCDAHCTKDLRYNSSKSVASALPLCALRPIQPPFEPMITKGKYASKDEGGDIVDNPSYKYQHPLEPRQDWEIQRNKLATKTWQENEVTWSWDDNVDPESEDAKALEELGRGKGTGSGGLVRSLKLGDVVTIWGKARFPGWSNVVEKVKVDIYWAV
ncbi:hypothetical protein GMORB2_7216 [Geosmithia morbida]|uniref:Uncharacterized protein n=1 Tax=Geosmithia morbida TaxID=1094350 RepID=A0A9P4YXN2_9HYPO|nr:uncharacterized protein GMORB2_7216 [Geosmithia morbida]KAF4122909.1 hypothetical protein GMORB2_7216 [Geosmithia morbida]